MSLSHNRMNLSHNRMNLSHSRMNLSHNRMSLSHNRMNLSHNRMIYHIIEWIYHIIEWIYHIIEWIYHIIEWIYRMTAWDYHIRQLWRSIDYPGYLFVTLHYKILACVLTGMIPSFRFRRTSNSIFRHWQWCPWWKGCDRWNVNTACRTAPNSSKCSRHFDWKRKIENDTRLA